ncbi:MAG: EAL domain-containing protein [Sedimenticolaceae bacterium]
MAAIRKPTSPSENGAAEPPSYRVRVAQIGIALAVLLAISALMAYRHVVSLNAGIAQTAAQHAQAGRLYQDALAQLYVSQQQLHDLVLSPDDMARQRLGEALAQLSGKVTQLAAHEGTPASQAVVRITTALREAAARLDAAAGESHEACIEPARCLSDAVEPLLKDLQQRLADLHVALNPHLPTEGIGDVNRVLASFFFGTIVLMILLGIVAYLSLDRLILRPLLALSSMAEAQSTGQPAVRETRDLLSAFRDLQSQLRDREQALDHLTHHDSLTGLPNRTFFRRRLAEGISAATQRDMLVGLLFLDLDRFKQVNDSYGHAAGDQVLIEISRRLRKVFRQDDLIARFGGDEFAVLLENLHERDEMKRLAKKALSAIQRPFEFDGRIFHSGASIGIAVAPDDGNDPDRLIQLADTAMYAAKRDEGSGLRFVSEELSKTAAAQHALENELRDAVSQHNLALHFQPVVALADGHIHCYESLLRWPHAEQGMLRPATFMDALADAGLCTAISDWALDQIQINRPTPEAVLSINLSARLLLDEDFAQRLLERLDQQRLIPERLILEITEDTLETDLRVAARVLHELKQRGVRIALDDFGTGQASLSHLRRFPFDYIKIDQSFVAGIGEVPNDEKLIQAIIRLAHALEMKVVAEGVETEAQRDFLRGEDCDYIQGYLVGKPSAGA